MPLISVLALLLSVLSVVLHHAHGGSVIACNGGISYNKACESECNNAYKSCNATSSDVDRVHSAFNKCGERQSKCMKKCYAKAVEMCTAIPSSEDDGGGKEEDNGHRDGDKGLSADIEEALGGIVIAIGIALVLYLLVKHDHGEGCKGEGGGAAERQELLERDDIYGDLNGRGREGLSSDIVLSNNNHAMVVADRMIPPTHYSPPAIRDMRGSTNQDNFLRPTPMRIASQQQPELLLV